MVGLKRRTRVEGWALDVSDSEEVGYKSALQRLGDNNRLWIATLIVLLVLSAFLYQQTKQSGVDVEKPAVPRLAQMNGGYKNQDHKDFADEFVREKGKDGLIVSARYTDDRTFMFVVPGDTSADDIEYLSMWVANKNARRFNNQIVVRAYQRSAASGGDVLRAVTKWEVDRYGFVAKFVDKQR